MTKEHPIGGHSVDLFARKGASTLALEVETGRSDWLSNVAAIERAQLTRRAVLWLDPGSLLRVRAVLPRSVELLQPIGLERWVRSLTPPA